MFAWDIFIFPQVTQNGEKNIETLVVYKIG